MSIYSNSRFALNPTNIDISRSTFDRDMSHKTTFNAGRLIPFYVDEVLPGDTFKVSTSKIIRMQSLISPIYDNLYLDTYYFFVPNRLVWNHWKNFMGENGDSAWIPEVEYSVPQLRSPASGWTKGTIADYFGIPTGIGNISVNALPFRAYALICNEWFRDQNLLDPVNIPLDEATVDGVNDDNYITDLVKGGMPFKVAKYHDYFTSALPAPQKGPDVQIGSQIQLGVYGNPDNSSNYLHAGSGTGYLKSYSSSPSTEIGTVRANFSQAVASNTPFTFLTEADALSAGLSAPFVGNSSSGFTINALRTAFQLQKLFEKDARGGTRYIEMLKTHFGVTSPDARLQRPEYLGGNRLPIHIDQVIQTSGTVQDSTPQGNPAAYSYTADQHYDFTHSFVEHGFVIGLMAVRYPHSYQQGIERMWSRKTRFDYYFPVLANVGEQGIKNKEIFAQGTEVDDEIFGYQEAWAEYRYKPNRVSGEMRSNYQTSLDFWHLADDYDTLPSLSPSWINEDASVIDRTLAVSERVSDQFFVDLYIQNKTTRAMPLYSIPGLMDHH
ncbi:major capsid protein [Capybara microvirus Cap1_SP_143]|nr:major capsid protein [Capybara microvirus Cap1_SP_143]